MNKQFLTLGGTPCGEDCVQVITGETYLPAMKAECMRYQKQLEAMFPIPESLSEEVRFGLQRFEHDFGPYFEVVIFYTRLGADFAYMVESKLPENWMVDEYGNVDPQLGSIAQVDDEKTTQEEIGE